jgi:hypothetical protein
MLADRRTVYFLPSGAFQWVTGIRLLAIAAFALSLSAVTPARAYTLWLPVPGPNACSGEGCVAPNLRPGYVAVPGPNACSGEGCVAPSLRPGYVANPGPNACSTNC